MSFLFKVAAPNEIFVSSMLSWLGCATRSTDTTHFLASFDLVDAFNLLLASACLSLCGLRLVFDDEVIAVLLSRSRTLSFAFNDSGKTARVSLVSKPTPCACNDATFRTIISFFDLRFCLKTSGILRDDIFSETASTITGEPMFLCLWNCGRSLALADCASAGPLLGRKEGPVESEI